MCAIHVSGTTLMNQEIIALINAAAECSVFINPTDPGLTYEEIKEVGSRLGFQAGEIGDALFKATSSKADSKRYFPQDDNVMSWVFYFQEDPDYRNFVAFDFIVSELNDRVRADGMQKAQIQHQVVVERAVAKGIPRNDIELAITYQVMAGQLTEDQGILRFPHRGGERTLPSVSLRSHGRDRVMPKPQRARVYQIVQDIIARRTDGRPQQSEPLDAFADQLDKLGYGSFRLWWTQTVAELRRVEPSAMPVSAAVLAAALVEGALTFVVKHARKHDLAVFKSSDFDREARTWKIDDLVRSAASGGATAVLDPQIKIRVETLIKTRQRIHAGRMLADFPQGVPDLRPEEARDAKTTAELAVRSVLDWLHKYPA